MKSLTDYYFSKFAQAQTCDNCLYFVNNNCQRSVGVEARHGKKALDEWTSSPNSINNCHYFTSVKDDDRRKDLSATGVHNIGGLYGI